MKQTPPLRHAQYHKELNALDLYSSLLLWSLTLPIAGEEAFT